LPYDFKKAYPLCIGGSYAAPPEDCGGPEAYIKLIDYYSFWRIKEKLIDALEHYEVEKDRVLFKETLEKLWYWANRHQFDCRKINRQLQRYFESQQDQLTVEEVQDED
jgi:hypothetical protein